MCLLTCCAAHTSYLFISCWIHPKTVCQIVKESLFKVWSHMASWRDRKPFQPSPANLYQTWRADITWAFCSFHLQSHLQLPVPARWILCWRQRHKGESCILACFQCCKFEELLVCIIGASSALCSLCSQIQWGLTYSDSSKLFALACWVNCTTRRPMAQLAAQVTGNFKEIRDGQLEDRCRVGTNPQYLFQLGIPRSS